MSRLPTFLTTCLVLCLAPIGSGQLKPVNDHPWPYVAEPVQGHCLQSYRLYLPRESLPMPPEGWPVLVDFNMSGFAVTLDTPEVPAGSLYARLLASGVALVLARGTPSVNPTCNPDSYDVLWGNTCSALRPPIVPPGHGLFQPPGFVPPDLVASGVSPYEELDYHMAEKDAVMLIQHVRHHARKTAPFATERDAAMSLLDHRRIAVAGTSAGAAALMWASIGPDRRDEAPFAGLGGQYDESSRPDAAYLGGPPMWWPMFRPELKLPVSHYGYDGHSTNSCDALMSDALPGHLEAVSPMSYEDPEWVDQLPVFLHYHEFSISEDYTKNFDARLCDPYPFCFDDQGMEGFNPPGGTAKGLHPAWGGYAWKTLHPESTHLVITGLEAFSQANGLEAVGIFDGQEAVDNAITEWVRDRTDELIPFNVAPAAKVNPGQKVQGTLAEDGIHSIQLDVVAGTVLTARLGRKKSSPQLEPALRLVRPDGTWDMAPGDTVFNDTSARILKHELPTTGRYRLEVLGETRFGGDYRLKLKIRSPSGKLNQLVTVGQEDGAETIVFDAVAGTELRSVRVTTIKPPAGAPTTIGGQPVDLRPQVESMELPDGGFLDLEGLFQSSPSGKALKGSKITLPQTGTYRLTLGGVDDSVGYARAKLRLARPKGGGKLELAP